MYMHVFTSQHICIFSAGLRAAQLCDQCTSVFWQMLVCLCEAMLILNVPGNVCWLDMSFCLCPCVSFRTPHLLEDMRAPTLWPQLMNISLPCFCHSVKQLSCEKTEYGTLQGGRGGGSDVGALESKSPATC